MHAPQELRKKARRCAELAADLNQADDIRALRDLAAQLEQQADEAEEQHPVTLPLH